MNGEYIFETLTAYQRSEALKAALELDLFTAIVEGATTASAISQTCAASERGLRILCDYLVTCNLLTKENDRYALTPESNLFLNKRSSAYFGTATAYWLSPLLKQAFERLTDAVRAGGTALADAGSIKPDHPIWAEFARAMMPMMAFPAQAVAKLLNAREGEKWKVLDVGAGHGLFGIAIARQNPNAEIVAVDWPEVLKVAVENAELAGVSNRYQTIPGSAFDLDLGAGYDLVLLTNFLHHFDVATCTAFLRKIYAVTNPNARVATLDFVANENRVTPRSAAASALLMLATTPAGDAYTFAEYREMFQNAGFPNSSLHHIPPALQQTILSTK